MLTTKTIPPDDLVRLGFAGGKANARVGDEYLCYESRPSADGVRLKVFANAHGEDWYVDLDGDYDFEVESPSSVDELKLAMKFLRIPWE